MLKDLMKKAGCSMSATKCKKNMPKEQLCKIFGRNFETFPLGVCLRSVAGIDVNPTDSGLEYLSMSSQWHMQQWCSNPS